MAWMPLASKHTDTAVRTPSFQTDRRRDGPPIVALSFTFSTHTHRSREPTQTARRPALRNLLRPSRMEPHFESPFISFAIVRSIPMVYPLVHNRRVSPSILVTLSIALVSA